MIDPPRYGAGPACRCMPTPRAAPRGRGTRRLVGRRARGRRRRERSPGQLSSNDATIGIAALSAAPGPDGAWTPVPLAAGDLGLEDRPGGPSAFVTDSRAHQPGRRDRRRHRRGQPHHRHLRQCRRGPRSARQLHPRGRRHVTDRRRGPLIANRAVPRGHRDRGGGHRVQRPWTARSGSSRRSAGWSRRSRRTDPDRPAPDRRRAHAGPPPTRDDERRCSGKSGRMVDLQRPQTKTAEASPPRCAARRSGARRW